MTNAFSRDYKPVIDLSDVTRENNIGRKHSEIRAKKLKSENAAEALQASGYIHGMKSEPLKRSMLKPSNLG